MIMCLFQSPSRVRGAQPGGSPFKAALSAGIVALATVGSARGDGPALIVHASGFKNSAGQAVAKLFMPGDNVLKRGRWEAKAAIKDGKAQFSFDGIADGDYAVVVFHDANGNGEIDHGLFGLPVEALGFSNGFQLGLSSGLPTFEKLRFSHQGQGQSITIQVEEL